MSNPIIFISKHIPPVSVVSIPILPQNNIKIYHTEQRRNDLQQKRKIKTVAK